MYAIIQSPSEILRTPAQPVDLPAGRQGLPISKLKKIIEEMKQTLVAQDDPEGVGLAANQVNLPYRLFLARLPLRSLGEGGPIHIFINPEIIAHSDQLQPKNKAAAEKAPLEGCLSLPKYYGLVKRWQWVKVRFQTIVNENFKLKIENFEGFPATVIQHEMDHLDGKIFVERIIEQNGKLYKSVGKNKKGKDIWDEVEI